MSNLLKISAGRIINAKIRVNSRVINCKRFNSDEKGEIDFPRAYQPHLIENDGKLIEYFEPPLKSEKPFTLVFPPPNITGTLHLGHALTASVQDALVRWNRMKGIETVWVPGMDHAGIATQVVVEKRLWKEKKQTRHDIGRELFEREVWKWKNEKAPIIGQQLRRLGVSLDWPMEVFTMDQSQCRAVTEAFIKLYDRGLIYRSDYLVNWSCALQSAISDIEVEHLEISGPTLLPVPGYEKPVEFGLLTKFAYKVLDSEEEIVVATTRPETMLGDVAVAVNPRDDRYSSIIGRRVWHPFRKEAIPVICDEFVDPTFGTGAVKVTPAHDHVDFQVGRRHSLDVLQVIDDKGNMNDAAGAFAGLGRFEARNAISNELDGLALLRGRQGHQMIVPICSRSKDVIEFLVKPQWFVKCQDMAQKALQDVKDGKLTIEPLHFEKIWFNWLENIRDWCVSRQLWWGHRVPAYLCRARDDDSKCWVAAENVDEARRKAAEKLFTTPENVIAEQDEDVLDTWFSSALFPFSVFGWPQQTKELRDYYPLTMMETGHDILFFWVARMAMLGRTLTGELPFSKVMLHGILCDAHGRKMSKSVGNVITPESVISGSSLEDLQSASKASHEFGLLSSAELSQAVAGQRKMFPSGIPACGADALRFTLCSHNIKNQFINFDVDECNTNKLFCNKIWQATKFTKKHVDNASEIEKIMKNTHEVKLSKMDRWILSRLSNMVQNVNEGLEKCDFHVATSALKNFLYYDFCDVYLESTKRGLACIESESAAGHRSTLSLSLDVGLRALAPFMPYLARYLHQRLPFHHNFIQKLDFPQNVNGRDADLEAQLSDVLDVVGAIRKLKKVFNIAAKHKPRVVVVSKLALDEELVNVIQDLTRCDQVSLSQDKPSSTDELVCDTVGSHTTVYLNVPLEIRESFALDSKKIEKKKTKIMRNLEKIRSTVAGANYNARVSTNERLAHSKKITSLEEELARLSLMENSFKM